MTKQVVGRQRELELVRAALASGAHILLEGPPGTGKSTLLRQVAASRHTEFVLVEGSAELTPARLVGSFDPALVLEQGYRPENFSDGPLVRAMREGGLLYVEELNRVPEETINVLLTVMSEGEINVPRLGRIPADQSFRLVAAMNPYDSVGTSRLSMAHRDPRRPRRRLAGRPGRGADHPVRAGAAARVVPAAGRPDHRGDLPARPGRRGRARRRAWPGGITSPPAAPGVGGRPPRPKSKTGRPDGGTTGRRELARHARFAEISPEVGVLDERAMSQALNDDPAAFELLAAMTAATDENLRAAAIRLSASIVLERARAGRPSARGVSRLRPVRGATEGDLDIDASMEGVSAARTEARAVVPDDLTTVQWARAPTAFAVVVDRSGSMSGPRLAAAATVAAACALRAPAEHAVLTFAGSVEVIRPLISDIAPAVVAARLLRMRGHGVTRLATALKAAGEQLAPAQARRRVVILLSDCRSTDEDDTLPTARALPELIILAPAGDHEQAAHLAGLAGARWAAIEHPLDATAGLDHLLETRVTA